MVRIGGPRNVSGAIGTPADIELKKPLSNTPPSPGTSAKDRARLGATPPKGSNLAGVMLGGSGRVETLFSQALKASTPVHGTASNVEDVGLAIALLRERPKGDAVALKLLDKVSAADGAINLVLWIRKERAINALAGHDDHLVRILVDVLANEPDAARRSAALETVDALAQTKTGSNELAAILRGAGCLPATHDWREEVIVAGSDPIAALVHRSPSAPPSYDAPDAAFLTETSLATRGLFSSPKWAHTHDLSTHRGIVGEVSRIADIEPTLGPSQSVIQGILVMESPEALWKISSFEAAKSWASAQGMNHAWLHHYQGPDGVSHYGVLKTEIDAAVFDKAADGTLAPVRFENVKAGIGSAAKARSQNTIAQQGWTDPSIRFLFPDDEGGYHIPKLDRSTQAADRITTLTVGPNDDPRYDAHLPLSMHDITLLSQRHP